MASHLRGAGAGALGAALALAACGGGGASPDAATVHDAALVDRCLALQDDWAALLETLDDSCATVADCVILDEHDPGSGSCDGVGPTIGSCTGEPRNRAAVAAAQAEIAALLAAWSACQDHDLCGFPLECAADCAAGTLACNSDGVCVLGDFDCLGGGEVDAGP